MMSHDDPAINQSNINLSSGEAESMAVVKAACEGIAVQRICQEWGSKRVITVYTEATAALALIGKEGLGRARHIDVGVLWLQQRKLKQELSYGKVAGLENGADLFIKYLARDKLEKFIADLGYKLEEGRAKKAVGLYTIQPKYDRMQMVTIHDDAMQCRDSRSSTNFNGNICR